MRKKGAGRPKRTDEPVRCVIWLPTEVRDELRNRAYTEGRTMASVVTVALRRYFKTKEGIA